MSLKSPWSTWRVPSQPGLCGESVSKKERKKKRKGKNEGERERRERGVDLTVLLMHGKARSTSWDFH